MTLSTDKINQMREFDKWLVDNQKEVARYTTGEISSGELYTIYFSERGGVTKPDAFKSRLLKRKINAPSWYDADFREWIKSHQEIIHRYELRELTSKDVIELYRLGTGNTVSPNTLQRSMNESGIKRKNPKQECFDAWIASNGRLIDNYLNGELEQSDLAKQYKIDTGYEVSEKNFGTKLNRRGIMKVGIDMEVFTAWVKNNEEYIKQYKARKIKADQLVKKYLEDTGNEIGTSAFKARLIGMGINNRKNNFTEWLTSRPDLMQQYQLGEINANSLGETYMSFSGKTIVLSSIYQIVCQLKITRAGQISSPQKLSDVLQSEESAQHAVRLVHGDEADLADILAVLYAGRITREDVLQFAEEPSLREYLGNFQPPKGIADIIEPGERLLPLDKDSVIKGIMMRRLREYRREKLGPKPTQDEQQRFLEEMSREMEALVT